MAPHWFDLVAWAALGLGFASALATAADIVLLGNRQHSGGHWFMMRIGMCLGLLTGLPVNRWLLSKGIKEPMALHAGHTEVPVVTVAAATLET
jgi:Domain of unknown function (DUF4396)